MDKKFRGYLDRLRENVEVLDEQIANARRMSRSKGKADKAIALQYAKTLRDLVELRNTTLGNVKVHLLGRDETGAPNEPSDIWEDNAEIEFERYFKSHLLSPWTLDDLKLKCEDCGIKSEGVSDHYIAENHKHLELCEKCLAKRTAKDIDESEEDSEASGPASILREFAETQAGGNVSSSMSEAMTGLVRNTIGAVALDARSPAEKVKMLEAFKAHLVTTAHGQATGANIEPGVALLDKEIERLRAEQGKGQDAAGKPVTILPP